MEIIFVKTRYEYNSYMDFWSLVELSGFPHCYVDEVDISKEYVYIVCPMNGEWRPTINNQHKENKQVLAHLILWNLERPSSRGTVGQYAIDNRNMIYGLWENGNKINNEGVEVYGRFLDEVWVSDPQMAKETYLRYVTLGSHEKLGEPGNQKQYDFCHMSYEVPRRQTIYKEFTNIGPNCWPPERDEVLKKSKFAVNVHQDNFPFQEPLRFALFAAYGLPIISEIVTDSFPFYESAMIHSGYDKMVERIKSCVNNWEKYKDIGMRARELLTGQYRFERMVKQAVKESLDWR